LLTAAPTNVTISWTMTTMRMMTMQTTPMTAKISLPLMPAAMMRARTAEMMIAMISSTMICMRCRKDERRYRRKEDFRMTMTMATILTTILLTPTTMTMTGMQRMTTSHC